MDESQAKREVKKYLDEVGEPARFTVPQYRKLYNALHDWANSPDEPDAELQAFKARMRAAIDGVVRHVESLGPNGWAIWIRSAFAPILAECEPPAPPKPKFAVGQVVVATFSTT